MNSAVADAIAMEALLRKDHGFITVSLLLNEDATKLNVERALDTACMLLARDDTGRLRGQQATAKAPHSQLQEGHPQVAPEAPCGAGPVCATEADSVRTHWQVGTAPPAMASESWWAGAALSARPGVDHHVAGAGAGVDSHLQQLVDCVSEAGRFILYFAGHGTKVCDQASWGAVCVTDCASVTHVLRM